MGGKKVGICCRAYASKFSIWSCGSVKGTGSEAAGAGACPFYTSDAPGLKMGTGTCACGFGASPHFQPSPGICGLLFLYVVTVECFVVAEVEFSGGDDGMGPELLRFCDGEFTSDHKGVFARVE